MITSKSLTIVIFGAAGNLYADKLAKALYLQFLAGGLLSDFKIFALARKDWDTKNFRMLTKDYILKRGEVDIATLDDFLSHVDYFKGDFTNPNDFLKLKKEILSVGSELILFHLATASVLYEKIFENIKSAGLNVPGGKVRIMIEKPFGKDEADAKRLQEILSGIFKEDQIFHIDHYLAKDTAHAVYEFKPDREIEKAKIIFHESNTLGARGVSYDKVGAFRDVGQNHMLELLALLILEKPAAPSAEEVRAARLAALTDLFLDPDLQITRGQYDGYHREPGIYPNSDTETFFRVFLKSKNQRFRDTSFELEGGKGLKDMNSTVTPTTVAVEIHFKDKSKTEIKIQPVAGTVYESYTRVYADAIAGDQTFFVCPQEILAEWRITDTLLQKWKTLPLKIYKKGSSAEEII